MIYSKHNPMKYQALTAALTTALYLGLCTPLLAAETQVANKKVPNPAAESATATATPKVAEKCMSDLQEFDTQMEKDGHRVRGMDIGYGYPLTDYAGGTTALMPADQSRAAVIKSPATDKKENTGDQNKTTDVEATANYWRARPAYEINTLVNAASILARRGQQEECEAVLNTTRSIYKDHADDMNNGRAPIADMTERKQQQIASAQPVTDNKTSLRSDQLIGTSVVSQKNKDLGNVEDIIISPKTGKIAYLVIGRGGLFGINEKYVPVPWKDFKITVNNEFLVLNTNKETMDGAPQVKSDNFSKNGGFSEQSKKVDDYWKVS